MEASLITPFLTVWCSGLHESLRMTVAIPLLNGVPPESEYLRCAPSWTPQLWRSWFCAKHQFLQQNFWCYRFNMSIALHRQVCHRHGRRICGENGYCVEHILSCPSHFACAVPRTVCKRCVYQCQCTIRRRDDGCVPLKHTQSARALCMAIQHKP